MVSVFDRSVVGKLAKPLDSRLVASRRGGGNNNLSYIEGHHVIDQANRIFGYGNWGYDIISCELVILLDPTTGEALGAEYSARVSVQVRDGIPVQDIGSQPVAAWNVYDQVMQRRESAARYAKTQPDYDSPITWAEKKNARAVITEAHEQAKKGAVTDAMKRAFRAYGSQFGNSLYGKGSVSIYEEEDQPDDAPVSTVQIDEIRDQCKRLQRKVAQPTCFGEARKLIAELHAS